MKKEALKQKEIIDLLAIAARSLQKQDNWDSTRFPFDEDIILEENESLAIIGLETERKCALIGNEDISYQERVKEAWMVDISTFSDEIAAKFIQSTYKTIKNFEEYLIGRGKER